MDKFPIVTSPSRADDARRVTKLLPGFLLLALLLIPGVCLSAQEIPSPSIITAVSVTGLKRTRPRVAEYPLKKFIGQDGMAIDFNDVHAAILDMGILEPLSIGVGRSPDGNGMILTVHVQEKWAFLPLPLLNADFSTFWSAGLAIMDNNAFGLNDKFVVEGTYGNTAWFASARYQYTPEREHFPGWYVMGMYGRQNEQDTDQHGRVLRKYGQDTIRGGLEIQYPITGLLSTSNSIYLEHQSLREFEDSPNDPGERGLSGSINPALEIGRNKWDGYLQSQQRAKLGYTFTLLSKADPADIHPLHTVSLRGVYEYSILPGFKAGIRGGIRYSPDAPPGLESSASSVIVDILPGSFSAQHYAGAAVGLEKFLYKFSNLPKVFSPLQGTLAVLISYQAVYSYGPILEHEFDHGVSGSLNFYLSRVAIPAMGFIVSYNVAKKELQYGLNMGASF